MRGRRVPPAPVNWATTQACTDTRARCSHYLYAKVNDSACNSLAGLRAASAGPASGPGAPTTTRQVVFNHGVTTPPRVGKGSLPGLVTGLSAPIRSCGDITVTGYPFRFPGLAKLTQMMRQISLQSLPWCTC